MASRCPSTFKPTVGGSTSLRSYNDFRFRDETGVISTSSTGGRRSPASTWRSSPIWGAVAPRGGTTCDSNLKDGYGIGFRFNTYKTCSMPDRHRLRWRGGVRYFFKFSKAF